MFWYTPYKRKAVDVDQIDFHMCQLHSRCDQVSYVRLQMPYAGPLIDL